MRESWRATAVLGNSAVSDCGGTQLGGGRSSECRSLEQRLPSEAGECSESRVQRVHKCIHPVWPNGREHNPPLRSQYLPVLLTFCAVHVQAVYDLVNNWHCKWQQFFWAVDLEPIASVQPYDLIVHLASARPMLLNPTCMKRYTRLGEGVVLQRFRCDSPQSPHDMSAGCQRWKHCCCNPAADRCALRQCLQPAVLRRQLRPQAIRLQVTTYAAHAGCSLLACSIWHISRRRVDYCRPTWWPTCCCSRSRPVASGSQSAAGTGGWQQRFLR